MDCIIRKELKNLITICFALFFMCVLNSEVCAESITEDFLGELIMPDENTQLGDIYEETPENIYVRKTRSTLPSSVDLSKDKYFPAIGKQYGGSCAAWATTYYNFTYEVAKLNNWDAKNDKSKNFSPKFIWNLLNEGENKGTTRSECYEILSEQGCVRWTDFPQNNLDLAWYQGEDTQSTIDTLRNALNYRVSSYESNGFASISEDSPISSNLDSNLEGIKEILTQGKLVTISTRTCNFETNISSNGKYAIIFGKEQYQKDDKGNYVYYDNGEKKTTGHSLTIVGYDDNFECDIDGDSVIEYFEKGAFLIANSWGTETSNHNNGFIWLMYDALNEVSLADSNISEVNYSGFDAERNIGPRKAFIQNYSFSYIEVEEYPVDLSVALSVNQKYRNELFVELGTSETQSGDRTMQSTFLDGLDGNKNFSAGNDYETTVFVFDYDNLYTGNNKYYWINVEDYKNNDLSAITTIKNIKWISKNGTVLKEVGECEGINNSSQSFCYEIQVEGVTLNKENSSLYADEFEQLTATVTPYNAANKSIRWTSSDTSVVKVSNNGLVEFVGTGTATVTATTVNGGCVASCIYSNIDDYKDTFEEAYELDLNNNNRGIIINGTTDDDFDKDMFIFTVPETGEYLIYTLGDTDTLATLYSDEPRWLLENDDAETIGYNFGIKYNFVAGETYYLELGSWYDPGEYSLYISKAIYCATLAENNQDARKVQMQAEASSVLNTVTIQIGSDEYTITKPETGDFRGTVNGVLFNITFENTKNGLSTIWYITCKIPPTNEGTTTNILFNFSIGQLNNINSSLLTELVAYNTTILTGVDPGNSEYLFNLREDLISDGYSVEIKNWDNTTVNVSSSTIAKTGMKVIKRNAAGNIVEIMFLVLFGDASGDGVINIGDGAINATDTLAILQDASNNKNLGGLAFIAADVNHDNVINSDDALIVNNHISKIELINQNYEILEVPDECYYIEPVIF